MTFAPVLGLEEVRAFERDHGPVRWVDARQGAAGKAAFAAAHPAGALHVDLEADLSGDTAHPECGGRHPLPALDLWSERLGRWGIAPGSPLVVYDDKGGANAASRFWWMMRAVGHARVALLDGGIGALVSGGYPLTAETREPAPTSAYPVDGWRRPMEDIGRVRALGDGDVLLDVREGARYRGDAEAVDPVAGHIPGALNLHFGENLGPDGRFLSAGELRAKYEALLGGRPASALVVSCGSGVTACHTLVALERAGLVGARLYVGSWSEWCRAGGAIARGSSPR